ncbi:response regulator transcription factor [Streptococcus pseudoporcinus]|uniref:Heme response regulator HssR n=1 Tax=Streptococcus pseudoporcinus LQ 940-04 TaxID=875093 RepID=G5K9N6_9STRE|nr:response regulator transcription factor [Streptococcus pseudoporcinus]EFR43565.1 response regulator receiver domain protein [Streptococcus pseudoporcinus SPIN 20026]EHI64044.1 response regulator receiver domain protein [Streptococcus pseudoporcinus LQ 940-04]VEF93705.1 putative heme response regulator HssR [Streptococcus pseudoporcinus]
MFTILVAEDDRSLNKIITTKLKQNHFTVYPVFNGQEALDVMEEHRVDVVITDIMMPVLDGYGLLKLLRESGDKTPVLMITAKSQFESLEEAFRLEVDDYLVKPIRLPELLLRVQALLRRAGLEAEQKLVFAHTQLDYAQLTMTDLVNQTSLQLPPKEFYLLYKLLSRPEKVFTRLDLLDDIWGMEDDKDERLVDACVKRLRQKCKGNPDFDILAVRGLGYKGRLTNGKS